MFAKEKRIIPDDKPKFQGAQELSFLRNKVKLLEAQVDHQKLAEAKKLAPPKEQHPNFPNECNYCQSIGACPHCWGRAAIEKLTAELETLKKTSGRQPDKKQAHINRTPHAGPKVDKLVRVKQDTPLAFTKPAVVIGQVPLARLKSTGIIK